MCRYSSDSSRRMLSSYCRGFWTFLPRPGAKKMLSIECRPCNMRVWSVVRHTLVRPFFFTPGRRWVIS